MRYTVTRQVVRVIGHIWQPGLGICAQDRSLSKFDLEDLGNPESRDDVEQWIGSHFGDFSSITDFSADFHVGDKHILHEWAEGEESEYAYSDAMFGEED